MKAWILLFALLMTAQAESNLADQCAYIKEALTKAPPRYTRTARVWVDGRERYFERVLVVDGHIEERVRRAHGAEVHFDPGPALPSPNCTTLKQVTKDVWKAEEPVPAINGDRVLTYVFQGDRLIRLRIEEKGSVGFWLLRKPIRFEAVYDFGEGKP